MNHSLPSPLQKIIIEYCHYPKLYLEELKEKTASICDFMFNYNELEDLGYSYHRIANCKGKYEVIFPCSHVGYEREDLILRKRNRDDIFGIKLDSVNHYQKGYYSW